MKGFTLCGSILWSPWGNKQRDLGGGGGVRELLMRGGGALSRDFWGFLITDENWREGGHPWQLLPRCKFGDCVQSDQTSGGLELSLASPPPILHDFVPSPGPGTRLDMGRRKWGGGQKGVQGVQCHGYPGWRLQSLTA